MHRDLAHIGTKLAAPLELQGRTSKKPTIEIQTSMGSWDNLLNRTKTYERVLSPKSVTHRATENNQASRTIHPEHNTETEQHKTRKIKNTKGGPEDPGNMLNLFKKSGTIDEFYNSKKKHYPLQTGDFLDVKSPGKSFRPHTQKKVQLQTHTPIFTEPDYNVRDTLNCLASPSKQRKQEQMKSAIAILPCSAQTKRTFQDRDEHNVQKSLHSSRHVKHLESTYQDQPLHSTSKRKDPNKQNLKSYEEEGKLHPFTKGKKTDYVEYKERNTSQILSPRANDETYSKKYGGMEPLNALYPGRKNIAEKQSPRNNIVNPPEYKESNRGNTIFSHRTFTSQITF